SVELFVAMSEAGADGFEVGIPYADPLMDGPIIMAAGELALERGVTVDGAFDIIARVFETTGKPVLAMTYVNPVLRQGITSFFEKAASAGAAGVIIPDLPADESEPFRNAARTCGVGLVLFAAPTTDDARLERMLALDPAFVYAIAEVGITGERDAPSENIANLSSRIRRHSDVPIVFGVGISTPEHVRLASQHGDGVIVGSAVVRRVLEANDATEASESLSSFVRKLVTSSTRI
ncbi:MAG: tryptophan synthase subunit alpha, partial [Acidimicrobiia bacterium]